MLRETNFSTLRDKRSGDQHSLTEFGGGGATTVAVVRSPGDTGIDDLCDEWYPELGMPQDALDDYWKIRSAYEANQYVSANEAANRAFTEANLEERFKDYVRRRLKVQRRLDELAARLEEGEDIVLVCFEGDGKRCHRHLLMRMLEKRVSLKA